MKYCSYCGNILNDADTVCMKCGCPAPTDCTFTIKRENQFYLVNPPINLVITGPGVNQNFSIKNGEILPIKLPMGQYNLQFSASFRKKACVVVINKPNTYFRLAWNRFSGEIEAWEISHI